MVRLVFDCLAEVLIEIEIVVERNVTIYEVSSESPLEHLRCEVRLLRYGDVKWILASLGNLLTRSGSDAFALGYRRFSAQWNAGKLRVGIMCTIV
jgi:hypothetical protein